MPPKPQGRSADRAAPPPAREEAVFGLRAALAVQRYRPGDILRVAFARELAPALDPLLRWAHSAGVPHGAEGSEALRSLAGSDLHEGVVVLARERTWWSAAQMADHLVKKGGVAVAFDRVRNPYNLGAVLRSAAFFGAAGAVFGSTGAGAALAPDAVRVSEGGAEALGLTRTTDLAATLAKLRERGVAVVGADGRSATDAFSFRFPKPLVLVLGHEREGLSEQVRGQCDAVVALRGAGAVESLNVAVAGGVLLAEALRTR